MIFVILLTEKNGECNAYHENRQLYSICNYVNGILNSEYKKYYDNGQLWLIFNYVDGKKNGEYKMYYEDGILLSHKIYENGLIVQNII